MTTDAHKETLEFQTEVQQLMGLMIHSLYSNKEIFLRELISNASDACDKLSFEALTDDALFEGDGDLKVTVDYDKDKGTVTISDNGVGMTRNEVVEHIGTIAKSGTRQFFDSLTGDQTQDSQLIGQFGVGFYSSFIVADKVTLVTRRAGLGAEHGVSWESDGQGSYTMETVDKPDRGTEVTLYLREDEMEFAESLRLRNIIHKYSDHISLPIWLKTEKMPAATEDDDNAETETEDEAPMEVVNQASALWARSKQDIKDEEYEEFYKHVSHDFEAPLTWSHNRIEGNLSYTSLLYIPKRAPFDLWDRDSHQGIKLYVRRVFIMDDASQLMPHYLRFVRGVLDTDDLPLNVSREILQHSKAIDSMRSASVRKVLDLLEKMSKNDAEQYATFWGEFGAVMKEGVGEDHSNKERIAKLLRFASTAEDQDGVSVSLEDYISRMAEGQDKIYYITADSLAAASNSPHLEVFRKKGIEVLLMTERVDEWMISHLHEFDGKELVSVAKGDLDLGDTDKEADKEKEEEVATEFKSMLEQMKETLGDKVSEVRISHRLTNSPSCLVLAQQDMAMHMQRILKQAGHEVPNSQPVLEINTDHVLIQRLRDETDDERFSDWTHVLFDQAMLAEGGQLEDPASFVNRLNELLLMLTK
ncbi:MAG: molecular chaperone HtpG [Gammaproteobacteria bacterium]|nr:molecular chaperone HtpG [Gammaproteobacteria bacterium]